MSVPPEEIAWQQAHASDYNAQGLNAFCIVGMCVVTVAVALRLWSRKMQKIPWQSDDWTLVVALFLTIASTVCFIIMAYHYGYGRHYFSLPVGIQHKFTKTDYAYNIIYTVAYPLSRISLVLLYRRIFIQQWFRVICWAFVGIFSAYTISTVIIDVCLAIPINAYWDHSIVPRRRVNEVKLYIANAAFNITTDCILLILPLTIIWRLNMTWLHKIGLSAIFALGTLTMVASIVRLVLFYRVNPFDTSYTLTPLGFWTAAEQFLGILCPCLVTFRPLIKSGYLVFSSRISSHRHRGGSSKSDDGIERNVHLNGDADHRVVDDTNKAFPGSGSDDIDIRSVHVQGYPLQTLPPPQTASSSSSPSSLSRSGAAPGTVMGIGRLDKDGMALDQEAALASLDPRQR